MTQTSAPTPQPRPAGGSPLPPSIPPSISAGPGQIPPIVGTHAGGGVGGPAVDAVEHYQHQPSFWQRKWVVVGMPIATSVLFHVGLIIAMVILAIVFGKTILQPPTQNQNTIPDSNFAENTPPGGVQFTGVNNDPFHQAMQDKDPKTDNKGVSDFKSTAKDLTNIGGGAGDNNDPVIEGGPGGDFGVGRHGHGTGTGDNAGTGDGPGGGLAAFGHPGGGGLGPQGPVFGNGGNALTIAFVCDASGSMMEKMEALKRQLSQTIEGLKPFQKFSITFFQNETPTFVDRSLILANPENKRKAESFLADVSTNGSTDPIPGLDVAFAQHPQLVYLLTDGDFPDNAKVLAEIHKLNPDNKVKINTIAFTDSSDHDVDFRTLLGNIAKESGGTFKSVDEEALND